MRLRWPEPLPEAITLLFGGDEVPERERVDLENVSYAKHGLVLCDAVNRAVHRGPREVDGTVFPEAPPEARRLLRVVEIAVGMEINCYACAELTL